MIFTSTVPTNIRTPVIAAEYLALRFTYHTAREWAALIDAGRVSVNTVRAALDTTVIANDAVAYAPYDFEEPPADLAYAIIYEDEWIAAVNKPANLLVHRAGKSFRNNLIYQLRHVHAPPYPDCRAVNRLDRNTSGVVMAAKNAEQSAVFGKLFTTGNITKRYKAVVEGYPNFQTPYTIEAPIAEDKEREDIRSKFKVDANGKYAVTIIEDARPLENGRSLLSIKPITGRTHQIRVHLSSIGLPIAGDVLYGSASAENSRHALHCESLSFIHPHTNDFCVITAPPPIDMKINA